MRARRSATQRPAASAVAAGSSLAPWRASAGMIVMALLTASSARRFCAAAPSAAAPSAAARCSAEPSRASASPADVSAASSGLFVVARASVAVARSVLAFARASSPPAPTKAPRDLVGGARGLVPIRGRGGEGCRRPLSGRRERLDVPLDGAAVGARLRQGCLMRPGRLGGRSPEARGPHRRRP